LPRALNNPLPGEPLQVVGSSHADAESASPAAPGEYRPVLWLVDASGAVTGPVDLGLPAGYDGAEPDFVNAHGWIAGSAYAGHHNSRVATLWRPRAGGRAGYESIMLGGLGQAPSTQAAASSGRRCVMRPGRPGQCR
jgi:hypothetical protein